MELTDEDLATPQKAFAKLGLRAQNEYLCLAGDADFRTTLTKASESRPKAFKAQQQVQVAEQKVQLKEEAIRQCLQQRVHLQARQALSATGTDANASNDLAEQLRHLQDAKKKEDEAARGARASANSTVEKFVELVVQARRQYDSLSQEYARLASDARVKRVLADYNATAKKVVQLGPSRYLAGDERKLKELEKLVLSEEIEIRQGLGGLWYVSAMFNGKSAQELAFDPDASLISLSWQMAQAAGLKPGTDARVIQVQMDDGRIVEAQLVVAKSVRVGKFTVENVECAVMPPEAALAGPLLGQTFLKGIACKIKGAQGKLVMTKLEAPSTKSPTRGSLALPSAPQTSGVDCPQPREVQRVRAHLCGARV